MHQFLFLLTVSMTTELSTGTDDEQIYRTCPSATWLNVTDIPSMASATADCMQARLEVTASA